VDVNRLVKQFELTRDMAKQMTGGKKGKRMAMPGGMPFNF